MSATPWANPKARFDTSLAAWNHLHHLLQDDAEACLTFMQGASPTFQTWLEEHHGQPLVLLDPALMKISKLLKDYFNGKRLSQRRMQALERATHDSTPSSSQNSGFDFEVS